MRKPMFCICENKDADQLRGNREADQRLYFHYIDSSIPLLSKYKISSLRLAIFCSCTAWFVSDRVRNQNVGFLMTWLKCQFTACPVKTEGAFCPLSRFMRKPNFCISKNKGADQLRRISCTVNAKLIRAFLSQHR